MRTQAAFCTLAIFLSASIVRADDWPQFRGPKRDEFKEVWRDKLLDNYSCDYIVWKGHVFGIQHNDTTSRIGPLSCFDIATGRKNWEKKERPADRSRWSTINS